MRELPRFTSTAQIQPAPLPQATPALDALNRLGTQIESLGIGEIKQVKDEQLQAIQQQAGTDLSSKIEQTKTQAQLKFSDPTQQRQFFNDSMKEYGQSYIQSLPDQAKGYAAKVLNNGLLSSQAGFDHRIIQQQHIDQGIQFESSQSSDMDNMTQMVNSNNILGAQQAYQRIINRAKLAAKAGVISPTQVGIIEKNAKKRFQSDTFLHKADVLGDKDPEQAEKYIQSMVDKGIKGYSNDEALTLANKGRTLLKNKSLALGVDTKTIDRNYQVAKLNALQKGSFNQRSLHEFQLAHPDQSEFAQSELNRNLLSNSIVGTLSTTSLADQPQALEKVRKQVDPLQFEQIRQQLNSVNKQIKTDPYDYFANNPAVLHAAVRQSEVAQGMQADDATQAASNMVRSSPVAANIIAQRMHGLTDNEIQAISMPQAAEFVQKINAADPVTKLSLLNQFMQRFKEPTSSSIAMRNLSKAGLDQSAQMVFSAVNEEENKGARQDLLSWIGADQKDVNQRAKDLMAADPNFDQNLLQSVMGNLQDFTSSLQNYPGDTITDIQNTHHEVVQYAKYLIASKGLSENDAAKQASDTLVNNHFNYFTINGKQIQVAKEISEPNLRAAFNQELNNAIRSDLQVPEAYRVQYPAMNEEELKAQYINDKVRNGYLLSNAAQSTGTLVDSDGYKLQTEENKPFLISYQALNDPTSSLYKSVVEYQQKAINAPIAGSIAGMIKESLEAKKALQEKGIDVGPSGLGKVGKLMDDALFKEAQSRNALTQLAKDAEQKGLGKVFNKRLKQLRAIQEIQASNPEELAATISDPEKLVKGIQAAEDQ